MLVSELIEALQKMPQDLPVWIEVDGYATCDIGVDHFLGLPDLNMGPVNVECVVIS